MAHAEPITVQVVYALAEAAEVVEVRLAVPATVRAAIEGSGLLERRAPVDLSAGVGVYGKPCALDDPVRDGDRVEIYRPLRADPKQARRRRAGAARRNP